MGEHGERGCGEKKGRITLRVKPTPAREGTDANHKRWAELMDGKMGD